MRGRISVSRVPSDANLTLRHRYTTLVLLLIILCWTIVVFFPVLQNDFVNWDDDRNLLENRNFRGLDLEQLRWMFTTFHMTLYRPLTWVSFGLDYLFWGMNPSGYHLTSLLLHAVNAIIFYFVALRLLRLTIATQGPRRVLSSTGGRLFCSFICFASSAC